MSTRTILIENAEQLNVGWSAFVSLLREQERLWRKHHVDITVFGANSYLAEARRCTEAFENYGSLHSMDLPERALVGGWLRGYRYFGNMSAAGRYMGIVKQTPARIDALLDQIPLHGTVEETRARAYLDGVTAMQGISLVGTATRLLVAKRPDTFLGLTSANRDGIKRVFGRSPKQVDTYLDLLRRIWGFPWYQAPCPQDAEEQDVWKGRVALLDAFVFATG